MEGISGGYVYIGGYQPAPEVLYLKAGRSHRPKVRTKAYGTMLPGGLAFMYAGPVVDSVSAERRLMEAMAKVESVRAIGGEWFQCEPFMRLTVLDELYKLSPQAFSIHPYRPIPFGSKRPSKSIRGRK